MTQRLMQLIARHLGDAFLLAAVWVFGEDAARDPEFVEGVAAHIDALVLALFGIGSRVVDLIMHKAETGGVLRRAGESKR